MAIDEGDRRELEEVLSGCIGERGTRLLMNELPPQGWHDFATKSDLELVQQALQADMRAVGSDLRRDMADRFAATTADISALRRDMADRFAATTADISTLRDEMTKGFAAADIGRSTLRDEMTKGFAAASRELHRWVMWQFVATSAVIATALSIYHLLTG